MQTLLLFCMTVHSWYKSDTGTKTNLYDPYAMGYRRATPAALFITEASVDKDLFRYLLKQDNEKHLLSF